MPRSVRFHPAAVEDAEAAVAWYAERSPAIADRFLQEFERLMDLISGSPERFQASDRGTRRALFRRFPYSIVFRMKDATIEVLAVAHAKRRPGFWRSRITR